MIDYIKLGYFTALCSNKLIKLNTVNQLSMMKWPSFQDFKKCNWRLGEMEYLSGLPLPNYVLCIQKIA